MASGWIGPLCVKAASNTSRTHRRAARRRPGEAANKDGDVLMTTHPELHWGSETKHHFQSVCKFINKGD